MTLSHKELRQINLMLSRLDYELRQQGLSSKADSLRPFMDRLAEEECVAPAQATRPYCLKCTRKGDCGIKEHSVVEDLTW